MAIAVTAFVASCSDDPSIGGGGSVPVADGFYVAKVGATPTEGDGLYAEEVEGDGFANLVREGFFGGFVYLSAGDYNIVNVIDQEIAQTYGGTLETATNTGVDCEGLADYGIITEYALDGPAVTISSAGLYKVMLDIDTKEVIFFKIQSVQIIGGATEFGWSYNANLELPLEGTLTATGATFEASDLLMKNGDWKIRFNCQWKIDRRIDPAAGYDASNGYVAHTNLGGNLAALEAGSTNLTIPFGSDGYYTITITWSPEDGFEVTTHNDDPIAPKAVNSYAWGIVGSATPNGWPDADATNDPTGVDHSLPLVGGSTTTNASYELNSIALSEGGEFKIRANNDWGIVLKPGTGILGTVTGDSNFESTGGGDPNWKVKTGGAGNYKVTVSTTNTGQTWNITFVKL